MKEKNFTIDLNKNYNNKNEKINFIINMMKRTKIYLKNLKKIKKKKIMLKIIKSKIISILKIN